MTAEPPTAPRPARRLGGFDAALVVMGGIVGSGIFMNPSVVAQRAHTAPLILGAWLFGGLVALIGGFVFAEIAWRRPGVGGLYGYMRDAYHPAVAFSYGWTALLATQSGGIAAAAVSFATYLSPLVDLHHGEAQVALAAIAAFSILNCFGVREGTNAQNVLMLLKGAAIVVLIVVGCIASPIATHQPSSSAASGDLLRLAAVMGAALIPVLYAYDGWQTAPFIDRELKDPRTTMPRGIVWGIAGVIVLYLAVAITGLRVLGADGLAATSTPASDIMAIAFGSFGQRFIALGIALSTLGFLSNSILTSARLYYAMAADGLFFKGVAWLHPKSRVPVVAIALQGLAAIVIALSGRYDQILNYVISIDFIYLGLAGGAVFIFRRQDGRSPDAGVRVPGHPWSTAFFCAASALVVVSTCLNFPGDTAVGIAFLIVSLPVYFVWRRFAAPGAGEAPVGVPRTAGRDARRDAAPGPR